MTTDKRLRYSEEDRLYFKKLEMEFSITNQNVRSTKRCRKLKTVKELYDCYVNSKRVLDQCKDILSQFTDSELVILLDIPIYNLERYYYAPIFSDYGFLHIKIVRLATELIERLKDKIVCKDMDKQNKSLEELYSIIRKLSDVEIKNLLGIKICTAKALSDIMVSGSTVDILEYVELYLHRISYVYDRGFHMIYPLTKRKSVRVWVIPDVHYYTSVVGERDNINRVFTVRTRNTFDESVQAIMNRL